MNIEFSDNLINKDMFDAYFPQVTTSISITSKGCDNHFIVDNISAILNVEPDQFFQKGDLKNHISGKTLDQARQWSFWCIQTDWQNMTPDEQIFQLFSRCTSDLASWNKISSLYSARIFIGAKKDEDYSGSASFSNTILKAICSRGLDLDLDVYTLSNKEEA